MTEMTTPKARQQQLLDAIVGSFWSGWKADGTGMAVERVGSAAKGDFTVRVRVYDEQATGFAIEWHRHVEGFRWAPVGHCPEASDAMSHAVKVYKELENG